MSTQVSGETTQVPIGRETGLVSPCISVCRMDEESGLCKGCLRTRAEIKGWWKGTREQQMEILATLKKRRIATGRVSQRVRKRRRAG